VDALDACILDRLSDLRRDEHIVWSEDLTCLRVEDVLPDVATDDALTERLQDTATFGLYHQR